MTAAANPYRSKYKPGDPVVFMHAGPNFQRTATIHTVRKDGALIVHFDDDPPRSVLVVQPYEIGPTATTTFRENPVEPWDDEQRRAQLGPRPPPSAISFDPRCFTQAGTEVFWTVSRSALHSGPARFDNEADAAAFANKTNSPMTRHEQPRMVRISWTCPAAENPRGHDLHARIAAVLGWPMRDVQSVSLQSLRDLVRPVSAKLADEISRVVQHAGHYVHTGVETSPTERQILDFMLVDAEDVDRGTFSRASTEEVAEHFQITPEVAYKRMNALAKRGIVTKQRDEIKKHRGATAVGYQLWEYTWKPEDEARAESIEAARRGGAVGNPLPTEHTEDEACTVGPDGTCVVCGVSHTGQCACGGRGFHRPKCPQAERGEPIAGRGKPMTKPGPNGVLYRITVSFRDPGKPAFDGEEHWSTWAYSLEHAGDLFREQHEGFQIVKTEMQTEAMPAENPLAIRETTSDWRSILGADAQYVPAVVQPQMQDVVTRALAAGARPPLEYMGAGMTSVVFCSGETAYKVGRRADPLMRRMLGDEAEWLAVANKVPGVREYVAQLYGFDPENVVITRACPRRDPEMTSYRYGERKLSDLHSEIERLMIPHGWTAPEFKTDSYVLTPGGPVLVDASMPSRVGYVLLDYVRDVLAGRRTTDENLGTLAFEVRREIGQTLTQEEAAPVLKELPADNPRRVPAPPRRR